jgi:uncharacterized tellurite resistance protein B-like protein
VASADGTVGGPEQAALARFLVKYGITNVQTADIRVYTPIDHAPKVLPELRDALLSDMCELAMADGLPDGSEARVIYAYAAEWGFHLEQAQARLFEFEFRSTSFARAFWLNLRNKLLPGRWDQTKL